MSSHQTYIIDGTEISAVSLSQAKIAHRQIAAKRFPTSSENVQEYITNLAMNCDAIQVNGNLQINSPSWVRWVESIDWSTCVSIDSNVFKVNFANVEYVVSFYALKGIS